MLNMTNTVKSNNVESHQTPFKNHLILELFLWEEL